MHQPEGPPAGRRASKVQRTRAAFVDAAVRLCLDRGYERTTVEQISALADMSPRTFARYFATKDEVFLAVLDCVADDLVAEVRRQPPYLGPLETLRGANVALFTRIAEHPDGTPSAGHVAVMLAVINSSDVLRQQAIRYRNPGVMAILAERMGVASDDRRLDLAVQLFNVTLVAACEGLVADTPRALLGPEAMVRRIEAAFTDVAACEGLVADTPRALLGPEAMVRRIEAAFTDVAAFAADLSHSAVVPAAV